MEMRLKRAVVQCTLTMMVMKDVQNTEGDYEVIREFVETVLYNTVETDENGLFDTTLVESILNPLWNYYMSNLHDGYNVTVPRKEM